MLTNTNLSLRSKCRSIAVVIFAILATIILFGCKSKVSDSEMVEISGVVYNNQSSTPLSQAIITNKNTDKKFLSDETGKFRISAAEGDSIIFTYVGMLPRTIHVSRVDSTVWNVGLDEYGPIIEPMLMHSYSTNDDLIMRISNPNHLIVPLDSLVLELTNNSNKEATYGDWFEIQKKGNDNVWREVAYDEKYRDKDGNINIVFNLVAYIISPHATSKKVEKPWVYGKNIDKGIYRIAKTFWIGEYTNRQDTAYVEFELQ
ncbi:MAG: carboxypeptidase-like regulatory domain-containing protein [Muribaculaceae bacterium]|nr:carboxypeptidase-like regulatory domain-containing protein [Muribaculaceae bacterium]